MNKTEAKFMNVEEIRTFTLLLKQIDTVAAEFPIIQILSTYDGGYGDITFDQMVFLYWVLVYTVSVQV